MILSPVFVSVTNTGNLLHSQKSKQTKKELGEKGNVS